VSIRAILAGRRVCDMRDRTRKPHIIKWRGYWQVYSENPTWQAPTVRELTENWERFR